MRSEVKGALTLLGSVLLSMLLLADTRPDEPYGVIASNLTPYVATGSFIVGAILWATGARWRSALFALAGILGGTQVAGPLYVNYAQWEKTREAAGSAGTHLRLISFNMLSSNLAKGSTIADALLTSEADVIFAMEAEPVQPFLAQLSVRYPYQLGCGRGTQDCDLMILSRFPLLNPEVAELSKLSFQRFMSASIIVGDRTIALVAVHLLKPYFDNYGWLEVRRLTKRLDAVKGPLVMAGDFNAATWSRTINLVTQRSGVISEPLPVGTWPSGWGDLGLPIDHVFTRPPLVIDGVRALQGDLGSNHRGLVVSLRLAE